MGALTDLTLNYRLNIPSDPNCRMKIGFPSQFVIAATYVSARGFSLFATPQVQVDAASNTLILTGCPAFTDQNSNGDAVTISSVRVPASQRDSDPFKISFFALDAGKEYLTASDNNGTVLKGGSL